MAALIDTNILVYRFDSRFPAKQQAADELLREGIETGSVWLAHQSILEFVAAVTRAKTGMPPLLGFDEAFREAEDLLRLFPILYPDDRVLHTALRGAALYRMAWFDAHLWAYAEVNELPILYSEDFEHERWYGKVQVLNPFLRARSPAE